MRTLLERYVPNYAPEEGAGAGGGGADAAAGGDAAAAAAAAAAAQSTVDQPAAGAPYRPEGLPDTMFGKDDRETIDKMKSSIDGYRQRDSGRGVPEAVDAYQALDLAAVPDDLKGFMGAVAKDPQFAEVSQIAFKHKVPVAALQEMTQAYFKAGIASGMMENPVDMAKELADLTPESAKALAPAEQAAAREARMNKNSDWLDLAVKNGLDAGGQPVAGGLSKEVAEHAKMMLMDTAKGHRFVEWAMSKITGMDSAQPLGGAGGAVNAENARAGMREQMTKNDANPNAPGYAERAAALIGEYKKMFPAA